MNFINLFLIFILGVSADAEVVFKKKKATIGSCTIQIEIADSDEKRQQGLMFRRSLVKDSGMLFIFEDERPRNFWMKNTFVPLSIGFFDRRLKLNEVLDMEPVKSEMETRIPTYQSKRPAKFALEMERGWFRRNKIAPGTKLKVLEKL